MSYKHQPTDADISKHLSRVDLLHRREDSPRRALMRLGSTVGCFPEASLTPAARQLNERARPRRTQVQVGSLVAPFRCRTTSPCARRHVRSSWSLTHAHGCKGARQTARMLQAPSLFGLCLVATRPSFSSTRRNDSLIPIASRARPTWLQMLILGCCR